MSYSVEHRTTSATIAALTAIWQRVLLRPHIDVDDNFFDRGGDPSLANELFKEIEQNFRRELSPLVIYCAPTIAALTAVLEEPAPPRFPPLVLLKSGTEEPPVFIAHGLGGNFMEFFQLVKHIRSSHPIYGIQAKGMDGLDEPLDSIEDMAQFHLNAIKELQPRGPYLLVGYSLGGLVTLEMAQRLIQDGEKVELLAMLDSSPHRSHLAPGQLARLVSQLAMRRFSAMIHTSERRPHASLNGSAHGKPPVGASYAPAMQRVGDSAYPGVEALPATVLPRRNKVREGSDQYGIPG